MKSLIIPHNYNYIAVFLTLACNLKCSYCINRFNGHNLSSKIISGEQWIKGLNRINSHDDLPITLEGGEPSLHPEFYYILNGIKPELKIDLLTNLKFNIDDFLDNVRPERFRRDAPYASIRVSYHPEQMDLDKTINDTLRLFNAGFSIGIWAVMHPLYTRHIHEAQEKCRKSGIDFRTKEFLGEYKGRLYGSYKYAGSCKESTPHNTVECKTSELIIGTDGNIYRCHSDLYGQRIPIGHLLDPLFQIDERFRTCENFGYCNPCDVKIKTNRFQIYGHTSVEIKFKEEKL